MEKNKNLDVERAKTMLVKQLHQESFYGVLGTHPKASREDIENAFRISLNKLANADEVSTKNGQLANVMKAYATLTSGYKEDYDEYIEQYRTGLEKAVELFSSGKNSTEELVKYIQPWATGMQPWSVLIQPWATGKKVSMKPWATGE